MTSGKFKSIPISSVIVNRAERQRREFAFDDLIESIGRIGLINPIVVDKDCVLVAGERRLSACKALGWTSIPAQFTSDLSPIELRTIELEENTKRKDLSWQEQALATAELHKLKEQLNGPSWTVQDTAKSIGATQQHVWQQISVAKELASGNKMVQEAPKFSVARGIVARKSAREKDSDKASILPLFEADAPKEIAVPLINESFLDWVETYVGPAFNFIHCDFPYGVNADSHAQGAAKSFGGYEDSAEIYWALLDALAQAMHNVVAESAHLIFWFSMDYYQETLDRLTEMGWKVNPFPLIWHKSDNSGILPDPERGPRRIYETAFFASRGDRKIVRAVSNLVSFPNEKEIHMSEKPKGMLEKFLTMVVDEYSVMLDPTCGSGNAVFVAKKLGAAGILGIEKDPTFFANAVDAWKGAMK